MKEIPGDQTVGGAVTLFAAVAAAVFAVAAAVFAVAAVAAAVFAAAVGAVLAAVGAVLAAAAVFAAEVVTAAAYDASLVVVDADADLCYFGTPILAAIVPLCPVYLLMVMDVEMCHPDLSHI
jgi:hypothetical protein